MTTTQYFIRNRQYIIAHPTLNEADAEQLFALEKSQTLPLGRGAAWELHWQDKYFILRHYQRGGFIANFNKDKYLFTGWQRTRAWREWHLLEKLFQQGLAVPETIACRIQSHRCYYQADLITKKITNSRSLSQLLTTETLDDTIWDNIGKTIKQFHDHDVYHADLNAHNILIDNHEKIWLIDFDKAASCSMSRNKRWLNLARLQRSLLKIKNLSNTCHWQHHDWQTLLAGYQF